MFLLESLILRGKLVSMPPLLRQTSLLANKNVIIKKSSDGVKKIEAFEITSFHRMLPGGQGQPSEAGSSKVKEGLPFPEKAH